MLLSSKEISGEGFDVVSLQKNTKYELCVLCYTVINTVHLNTLLQSFLCYQTIKTTKKKLKICLMLGSEANTAFSQNGFLTEYYFCV
jgi:hypothetical protein